MPVRFLLVRDCNPALHAGIAVGEALFCLTVDYYSICNFLSAAKFAACC